jgi:hypothetical protein
MFSFSSFQEWVVRASTYYGTCPARNSDLVAIDREGRICRRGEQFMRARDDGVFPVVVYHADPQGDPQRPPDHGPSVFVVISSVDNVKVEVYGDVGDALRRAEALKDADPGSDIWHYEEGDVGGWYKPTGAYIVVEPRRVQ